MALEAELMIQNVWPLTKKKRLKRGAFLLRFLLKKTRGAHRVQRVKILRREGGRNLVVTLAQIEINKCRRFIWKKNFFPTKP